LFRESHKKLRKKIEIIGNQMEIVLKLRKLIKNLLFLEMYIRAKSTYLYTSGRHHLRYRISYRTHNSKKEVLLSP